MKLLNIIKKAGKTLLTAYLASNVLIGCDPYKETPKVNYENKKPILRLQEVKFWNSDWGRSFAAGDIDGDKAIEILSTDTHGNVFLYENTGNNNFVKQEKPLAKVKVLKYGQDSIYVSPISLADVDGDGLADLLSADKDGNIFVHKNIGNNKFYNLESE